MAEPSEVLALSRLVVAEGEPQNATGLFLAASTRIIAADARYRALVTFADSWQEHTGTIYRATGWTDTGDTKPSAVWTLDGRAVSSVTDYGRANGRRLTTSRGGSARMLARGCVLEGRFAKRRFVKVLVPFDPAFIGPLAR